MRYLESFKMFLYPEIPVLGGGGVVSCEKYLLSVYVSRTSLGIGAIKEEWCLSLSLYSSR